MRRALLLSVALASSVVFGASQVTLSVTDIASIKKKPCAFVHVWATWCSICVQEMPSVIKFLSEKKKVTPVVIDVSSPMVQKEFSRAWMKTLKPPFATYFKPAGDEEKYLSAIDPHWSGALPFTVLYHGGKKRKKWVGSLDLPTVESEIATICR